LRDDKTAVAQVTREAGQEIRRFANARGDGLKERIVLQLERLVRLLARRGSRLVRACMFVVEVAEIIINAGQPNLFADPA
jgi:hypothetical protein